MRALAAAALGLGALSACSGAPRAVVADAGVQVADLPVESADEPRLVAEPPPPSPPINVEDLGIPSERSCLLRSERLEGAMLRLRPDGEPFAQVAAVHDVRVHVTADPVGTGLVIELEKGPVSLAGITPAQDMDIYAKQPITLGGIFSPAGDKALRITGASRGRVVLAPAYTPYGLRDLTVMLDNDVPCESASLLTTRIDARAPLGRAIGSGYLVGEVVPLSRTANGEPVASLMAGLAAAEILERRDGAARIVWQVDGGYVRGWVPAQNLGAVRAQGERGGGRLGGRHRSGRVAPRDRRICERDVALAVELKGQTRFVGRIRSGAVIEVWGASAGSAFSGVTMPAAEISLLNGASLLVRSSDIEGCPQATSKRR